MVVLLQRSWNPSCECPNGQKRHHESGVQQARIPTMTCGNNAPQHGDNPINGIYECLQAYKHEHHHLEQFDNILAFIMGENRCGRFGLTRIPLYSLLKQRNLKYIKYVQGTLKKCIFGPCICTKQPLKNPKHTQDIGARRPELANQGGYLSIVFINGHI